MIRINIRSHYTEKDPMGKHKNTIYYINDALIEGNSYGAYTLKQEVADWVAYNIPKTIIRKGYHEACLILESEEDYALFKLFWLW